MKGSQVDLPSKFIEHLDEAAHVRSLERMREVDVHVDGSVNGLSPRRLIQNGDGILDPLDPDLLDVDFSVVFLALNINHGTFLGGCDYCFLTNIHPHIFTSLSCDLLYAIRRPRTIE